MSKNKQQQPKRIPVRQSTNGIISMAIFGVWMTIGSIAAIFVAIRDAELSGRDAGMLLLSIAAAAFFLWGTFAAIRNNIRLDKDYYHQDVPKPYYYKDGDN